jgi:uncharacterized protein with FMN-binding domain
VIRRVISLGLIISLSTFWTSCSQASDEEYEATSDEYFYDEEIESDDEQGYEDGTYTASVDYYNPETGYSATYTLDVEVVDNEVTVIYFPNDGYLDEDHIWPTALDSFGYASVDGENGKTYEVQIL